MIAINTTDIEKAVAEILDRREHYEEALSYYDGTVEERWTSLHLKRVFRQQQGGFRINFAGTVVDTVLDRLEIAGVTTTDERGDEIVSDLWETNELMLEADEIHKHTLIYGDAYATVWPVDGELQVYYNSPVNTVIVYDEEFPRRKKFGAKVWTQDNQQRLNLYYADRIEKYVTPSRSLAEKDGAWQPYSDEPIVDNPFGEVPVFHFRTQRPFGRPEHFDAYGPQDAVNKLVITQMHTVDYQGAPQRYALASNQMTNEITDFDAKDTDRENLGALQNGPGELWYLKGIDEVGQFDPADPHAFLDPMREFVRAIATSTSTPLHYFEKAMTIPSGESLRVAESPLNKKVFSRQTAFGETWRQLLKFALKIEGIEADVQVKWHRHESIDEGTEWENSLKKLKSGLPLAQVLTEMGYDKDIIDEWVANGAHPLIPGLPQELVGEGGGEATAAEIPEELQEVTNE